MVRTRGKLAILVEVAAELADAVDRLDSVSYETGPTVDELWEVIVEVRSNLGRALTNQLHVASKLPF